MVFELESGSGNSVFDGGKLLVGDGSRCFPVDILDPEKISFDAKIRVKFPAL